MMLIEIILRKEKFSENHILEIIEVCSFFNMTNRIASGTNMRPNKEYYFFTINKKFFIASSASYRTFYDFINLPTI